MYRDDLAAAHARLDQLQRELADASSQGVQDRQRIAALTAQLTAAREALARIGVQQPVASAYGQSTYLYASRAGAVLALGILSLVVCQFLGPIAWAIGNEELRRIDGGQVPPHTRSNVVAGRICGIIGTVTLILGGLGVLMVLSMVRY